MKKVLLAACAVALTIGGLVPLGLTPAAADPATTGAASAYGANINLSGQPLLPPAGLATATLPPGGIDGPNSLLLVPVDPVLVSGTAIGGAGASAQSVLVSTLAEVQQQTPGPYNVLGVGVVENLGVVFGVAGLPGIPLVGATAVRGEAAGVCRNGVAEYTANSEILNLSINGNPVGLNAPVTDLLNALNQVLAPLGGVVSIELNERVVTPGVGASVNALHVTVLGALGVPLLDLIVGRAQVGGLTCTDVPECSDTQDNDGDGVIDANDPGCDGPDDDDERNECIDGIDNADPEDTLVDFGNDPGCTDPQDDSETDEGGELPRTAELPRTGADLSSSAPIAVGLSVLALVALAVRRRSQA